MKVTCPTCEGAGEIWVEAPNRRRAPTMDIVAMPDMVDDARLVTCGTCLGDGETDDDSHYYHQRKARRCEPATS